MAMSGKNLSAEMNVTPMIDVLLVLIVIFMLMPHHTWGERALVPQPAERDAHQAPPETVVLQLKLAPAGDPRPTLLLNQEPIAWDHLQARLQQVYGQRSSRVLFINADDALTFDPVAQAIDMAHGAVPGLMVGLMTAKMVRASQ